MMPHPDPLPLHPVRPPSSCSEYIMLPRAQGALCPENREICLAFSACLLRQLPETMYDEQQSTKGALFLNGISTVSDIQAP